MKSLIAFALVIAAVAPAQARVRNVVTCADEATKVTIDTTGFGSDEYQVVIKDLRNGEEFPYRAVLQDTSFVSEGNPTINTDSDSIAFVKAGWGLVVLTDCTFNF